MSFRTTLLSNDSLIWKISFWEVPALERHMGYLNHYALGSSIAVVVFDLTKRHTFEKAELVLKALENVEIAFKFLVGNKSDLLASKKNLVDPVNESEVEIMAKNYNCSYIATSINEVESVKTFLKQIMKELTTIVGNKMELQVLLGKNISVGNKLFEHETFLKNLKDTEYFDN